MNDTSDLIPENETNWQNDWQIPYFDNLTEEQQKIVSDRGGELLVSAAAGSGKTRVLTFRIAHMLGDLGVKPWQVLVMTFTNKAAAEMRERLTALIPSGTRGMWVCTFHAMCVRMLREDAYLLFVHNVQGNLAVNRLLGWRRGPEFAHAQELLSAYSEGGMRAVSARHDPRS